MYFTSMFVFFLTISSIIFMFNTCNSNFISRNTIKELTIEQVLHKVNNKKERFFLMIINENNELNNYNINSMLESLSDIKEIINNSTASFINIYYTNLKNNQKNINDLKGILLEKNDYKVIDKYSKIFIFYDKNNKDVFVNNKSIDNYHIFEDLLDYIISKYMIDEKDIIYKSFDIEIQKETDEHLKEINKLNNSNITISNNDNQKTCKKNPFDTIKEGLNTLNFKINELDKKVKNYKLDINQDYVYLHNISHNVKQVKPISIIVFIVLLIILVSVFIVIRKIKRKKHDYSIV